MNSDQKEYSEMEEEVEPMDMSEEFTNRIEQLRIGLVNSSADLFFDLTQHLDDVQIMRTAEEFVDYFRVCLTESPSVFSMQIDPNALRTDSEETYSQNRLRVFSKWIYRVCGAFLLCPRLGLLHSAMSELVKPLFLTLKYNHSCVLAECFNALVGMIWKLQKVLTVPGGFFKISFKHESPRRNVHFRTPVSSISLKSILNILHLIVPHLDVIKRHNLLLVQLFQTVQFLLKESSISAVEKMCIVTNFCVPLQICFPEARVLWCEIIALVVQISFKTDVENCYVRTILNRVVKYECPDWEPSTGAFLVELENLLLKILVGRTFICSKKGDLKQFIVDIYKQVRAIIDAHHLDAYSILRKENSIELASYIYDEAPVLLPVLADVVHKEMFRVLQDSIYTEPLNYSEIQSRARIWDTVNEKWLQEISNVEAALKDNKIEADDKRIEVKKLFERTIPFSQLLADVSAKGNALENLRRCAKGGCVQDLIFWDDFIQNFDRMLHIVTDITPLIADDPHSFLEWIFVFTRKVDGFVQDRLLSLHNTMIQNMTLPFFPTVYVTMSYHQITLHREKYGFEMMEESVRILGSDMFLGSSHDTAMIKNVLEVAMNSVKVECIRGFLYLIGNVKLIIRILDKAELLQYMKRLVFGTAWTEDEKVGVLLAKAVGRLGCIFTKAAPWTKNGACEVCDTGCYFYEPSNCKMKQVREFVTILMRRGSMMVRMEVMDSIIHLKRHGLIPNASLIASLLAIAQGPRQFGVTVKLLRNSTSFLTVTYPKQESKENAMKLFRMIFAFLRRSFTLLKNELMYDVLVELLDTLALVSKLRNDLLCIEVSKTVVVVLVLRRSNCIGNKCKLILRCMAETRQLRTSEYMGQIREFVAKDFIEICLLQSFGKTSRNSSEELNGTLRNKCEAILRGVEYAMEFKREDFIQTYFPIFLAHLIPLGIQDKRAGLMIASMAQLGLVTVKELLEMHFPVYFPAIGITMCQSMGDLNKIIEFLETYGISLVVLTSFITQVLMNELLSFLSVSRDRVKSILGSMLLWKRGTSHILPHVLPVTDTEIQNFITERLMGYFVYFDCKMEGLYDNRDMKRRIFSSFIEVISFLGTLISGMKMRIAKLLISCCRKPYLQDLGIQGWKAYTFNLEDDALPAMMNEILASVLSLKSNLNIDVMPIIEEIANYVVTDKLAATRNVRHQIYYIVDHIKDRRVVSLVRNSKYVGAKLFELLNENMVHGNSSIRYQALLAVRRIVNGEDTTVDLKELLEDSQFVHPIICKLILGLLDCAKSQDKEVSSLTMSVIGELGAIDYYRMKVKHLGRQSRRDGSAIFPTGIPFAHAYIDMLRKQYQGTKPSDIDICAYAVQEVLRIYNVEAEQEASNPIWTGLPSDSQSLFYPLLRSKFSLKDVILRNDYPFPIYGSEFGKTFQDWCTNFVLLMYTFVSSQPAKEIFRVTLPLMVRSMPVALYMLPYVALFASMDGTPRDRSIIYKELQKICRLWFLREEQQYAEKVDPFGEDSRFEEPATMDASVADRLCVTNAVFSIVDLVSFVSRYGRSNFSILNNIATKGYSGITTSPSPAFTMNGTPLSLQRVVDCRSIIPDPLCMARASFQTQSYQRALMNLEEFLFVFPERTQKYLPFLQRIFIALEDTDSLIGASTIRKGKPNICEETLELLATGKKEDAASKFQVMMQKGLCSFVSENVLIRGYLSIEKPEMALTIMNGLAANRFDMESYAMDECRIEACWKLQRWGDLRSKLKTIRADLSSRPSLMHAAILSHFQRKSYPSVLEIIGKARELCQQSLATIGVSIDSYHRRYAEIARLQILSEIEQAVDLMQSAQTRMTVRAVQAYRNRVAKFLRNWKGKLDLCQKSLNIIEPIVNTRKALLHIMKDNTKRSSIIKLYSSALRDCWLTVAKFEIRAKNYGRANTCIQEARQFRSPEVFIQHAKFLSLRGDTEKGIRIIHECLKQYFTKAQISEWESQGIEHAATEEQDLCAKSLLLLAKFNDEKCNVDIDVNIENYLQVTRVYKKSEKNFFHLASYYDSIWSNQKKKKNQSEMQLSIVQYYCKSLEYGSKHVYQSLPRLLFVWFHFASNVPKASSGGQRGEYNAEQKAQVHSYDTTVTKMSECILNLFNIVPAYIFLTAYSQLISRICHPHADVWIQLKHMIAEIVIRHPHQAIWMMLAVSNSTYKMRKTRCAEILRHVEEKTPNLKPLIRDYSALANNLILLANNKDADRKLTTIDTICPSIVRLFTNSAFSKIIMPYQQYLSVTISRVGSHHLTHNPFQQSPVFIHTIEKNVEVMPSLQRPKKITVRGTDGRLYGILCKPADDLRKDSKVMEMNHIVNWYLLRSPEARQRNLHVRTYAVVALNEDTGLLEWVPNLQGLRPLLNKLYREKGLYMESKALKELYASSAASLEEKLGKFQTLVDRHPPILREWFQTYFSDPQEWYTARSTFTRTCAVMSMVGYLIGLGDRHGENILLDSVTGDVVHVDFNCLFNKGETFDVPEVVPFRLTHNMTNAMGPLLYEGPFRRCCEITINILRDKSSVFMSVLRPFVFDPLVEWSKSRHGAAGTAQVPVISLATGEVSNVMAVENIRAIQLKLQGVSRNMTKELNVPLSVEAQVSYLIKEATADSNLCQMYVGWGPFY